MTEEEIVERTRRHKKRVERRAAYLAKLTPEQRWLRDKHVAWVRFWRKQWHELMKDIILNKHFIRHQGHNNLLSLKMAMALREKQKMQAQMMLRAREDEKIEWSIVFPATFHEIELEAPPADGVPEVA